MFSYNVEPLNFDYNSKKSNFSDMNSQKSDNLFLYPLTTADKPNSINVDYKNLV